MKKRKEQETNRFLDDLTDGFEAIQQYVRGERELRVTTLHRAEEPDLATNANAVSPYVVLFEQGPRGWAATVPDLPGCVAAAPTLEEVEAKIAHELRLYAQASRKAGHTLPAATTRAKELSLLA
jgi:predicted RNase H-like HicB family nuclease